MHEINPYASPEVADLETTPPPRTVAGIFGAAAGLFQKNFLLIFALAVGAFLPFELLGAYLEAFVFAPDDVLRSLQFDQLVETLLGTYVAAGVIEIGTLSIAGERPTLGLVLRRALRAWPRLLLTRILCGLAIVAGLLLLVVPGIFLVGRLCLADAVTVREGLSGRRAMQRSFALTKGRFLTMFAVNASVIALVLIAVALVSVPSLPFPVLNHWIVQGVSLTLVGLPLAYGTLCFFCAYEQLAQEV